MDLLVGAHDIAQRLGWRHQELVHYYLHKDETFPRPAAAIGGPTRKTLVWLWPDVERWAVRTGRLPTDGVADEA
ncbi:MAG: hypothetical protein ACRDZW_07385 [Acidimicrobiales bacterium]